MSKEISADLEQGEEQGRTIEVVELVVAATRIKPGAPHRYARPSHTRPHNVVASYLYLHV